MTVYYVALGIGILAGIGGQILLKAGADAPDFFSQLMRPSTIAGLALYGSAAFLYIIALRKLQHTTNTSVAIAFQHAHHVAVHVGNAAGFQSGNA